jgi:hypothetical protein
MPDILVTDAISVKDAGSIEQLYLLISVSDITDASDAVYLGSSAISAYDSVSILESPTIVLNSFFDQSEEMTLPVWELQASFAPAFTGTLAKLPTVTGLGYFGARLSEERIPLRTISANIADPDVGLSGGVNKLPTWSMSGSFGMRLNEYIPVRTLSASFEFAGIFSLDTFIPVWKLSASFKYPDSFTLSRQIPIWIGQGSMVLSTYAATLNVKIPGAFVFTGSMRENTEFSLAANIPVWRLESSMYCGEMWLDGKIPVWMMGGNAGADIGTGSVISYHSRFTDYILRYIRP